MAQKANLPPVDKYESDRREAERLELGKHARLEAGLIDPVSAIQPAPTAEHQHREGLTFWQAFKTMFKETRPDDERRRRGVPPGAFLAFAGHNSQHAFVGDVKASKGVRSVPHRPQPVPNLSRNSTAH